MFCFFMKGNDIWHWWSKDEPSSFLLVLMIIISLSYEDVKLITHQFVQNVMRIILLRQRDSLYVCNNSDKKGPTSWILRERKNRKKIPLSPIIRKYAILISYLVIWFQVLSLIQEVSKDFRLRPFNKNVYIIDKSL